MPILSGPGLALRLTTGHPAQCDVPWLVAPHLARNVTVLLLLAGGLLTVFEVSNHRVPVLPADASPGPVLVGAVLVGVALTIVERRLRRRLG